MRKVKTLAGVLHRSKMRDEIPERFPFQKRAGLWIIMVTLLVSPIAYSQSRQNTDDIQKQIRTLQKQQKQILAKLNAIEELLTGRHNVPPSRADVSVEGSEFKGDSTAKVTVVEFFDYQCPFCKRYFNQTMPRLTLDYIRTGKVKYVIRDFPLDSIHPNASIAAEAARCAGDQGKFWLMHDELMSSTDSLDRKTLSLYAQNLALDPSAFDKCVDTDQYGARILQDIADGGKAGVDGTPTFFLGRTDPNSHIVKSAQRFEGAVPYDQLKQAIENLLAQEK